jgi:tetratricopeptide (TPR) repeat protein
MQKVRAISIVVLLVVLAAVPALAGFGQINATTKWLQGKQAFLAGNYSQAIAIWTEESVVKYNVSDPGYYYWLANAYARTGANDKAVETAKKGLALGPKAGDPNVVGNLQWVLGQAYNGLKQYDSALAAAQAAIAAQPQDPDNYNLLANIYMDMEKYDDAMTAAKRMVEMKPSPAGYSTIALCCYRKGDLDSALDNINKGLALAPQDANLLMGQGRIYFDKFLFDQAASSYSKALEAKAQDARSWIALCRYYQGRYDDALAQVDAGATNAQQGQVGLNLKLNEHNAIAVASVEPQSPAAEAGLQPEDWIMEINGEKTYKGMVNITPLLTVDEAAAKLRGAPGTSVELKLWRPSGKVLPFKRTVVRKVIVPPSSALDYAIQSLALRAKGDSDKALSIAEKAAGLDSSSEWAQLALGFALLDKGRYDEALTALQHNATGLTIPYRQLGRAICFAKKGDLKGAADIYFGDIAGMGSLAKTLDARCVPLWHERGALLGLLQPTIHGHLDQAKKLEAEGKYADALPEYAQALRFAADDKEAAELRGAIFAAASKMPTPPELPEDARERVVRGETLIKDGDLAAAVKEFNEAIGLAPYMPKLYYNAALLNGQLKRYAEAIRLMNIYLQGAPDAPDARAAKDEIIKWKLEMERQGK